jgi:hypothetical protein
MKTFLPASQDAGNRIGRVTTIIGDHLWNLTKYDILVEPSGVIWDHDLGPGPD